MVKVLIVLGSEGLEYLVDLTEAEFIHAENALLGSNKPIKAMSEINAIKLAVRYNSHRNPQGYLVELPMSIEEVHKELLDNKYFREMITEKATKCRL